MKKCIFYFISSLLLCVSFSLHASANIKKRYKLVGTIISNKKGKSFAIIRDLKNSETKILKQGKNLNNRENIYIKAIEKDKIILSQKSKNNRILLYQNRSSTAPKEEIAEQKKYIRLKEMKETIESLNNLRELRSYFKEKEKELEKKARR